MHDEFLHSKVTKSNLVFNKYDLVKESVFLHSHPLLHGKINFRYSCIKKNSLKSTLDSPDFR